MKKKPQYSDVKFDVNDLELRKHRLKNKAPDKEIKPCMNEYISISRRELIKWAGLLYAANYRPAQKLLHNIQHKLQNKKYITEKPESAWDMFRRLYIKHRAVKIIPPLAKITRCAHLDSIMLSFIESNSGQEAKNIIQDIEKEIKE